MKSQFLAFFLLFLASGAFAAPSVLTLVTPNDANYMTGTVTIVFSATDSNSLATDLDANVFYSITAGAFSNPIAAVFDLNSDTCGNTNFSSGVTCSLKWNTTGISDGNYFIDLNVVNPNENAIISKSSAVSFALDSTPPAKIGGLTATAGDGQVSLAWTGISDTNHYNIYMGTVTGFTTNANSLIAASPSGTASYVKTGLTNGTQYFFKVSAKDRAGNEGQNSDEANVTPANSSVTPSTPSISSSTHANDSWSTNNDPQFSWAAVGGATYYSYLFNQASDSTPSENNGAGVSFNPDGTQTDGIWYFHLRACNASNACSSTSHFKVKIDRAGPEQPQNVTLTANDNGTVGITWDAVSDNPSGSNSGVKEYKIYRKLNDSTPDDSDSIATTATASYADDSESLNNNVRYYYRVRAFDNAGNSGTLSAVKSVLVTNSGTSCGLQFSYNISSYLKGGEIDIRVTSNKTMVLPNLKVRVVGAGYATGTSMDYKSTYAQGTYNFLPEHDGKSAEVTLTATDPNGVACVSNKTFTIDSVGPLIENVSPSSGADVDLSLAAEFGAKITDAKSGVEGASLFYKKDGVFEKIGDAAKGATENYSVEVLPAEVTDLGIKTGSLELKIEAKDNAGNISEKIFTINVAKVPETQEVYSEKEYTFNKNGLDELLKNSGLEEKLIPQAKMLIKENNVSRKFKLVKSLGDEYSPFFTISFTNNSSETLNLKLVEVVPKAVANNAKDLHSAPDEFTVLLDDPVIEFSAQNVTAGQSVEFTYGLSPVSKENADKMISQNLIQKFVAPPIVVNSGTDLSQSFKQNSGFDNDLIFLVILGIMVLFVVFVAVTVIGGGVVLHLHRKSKEVPLGRTPPAKKFGMGPMEKSSGDLHKWFEQKEVEQRPGRKFKFREKD